MVNSIKSDVIKVFALSTCSKDANIVLLTSMGMISGRVSNLICEGIGRRTQDNLANLVYNKISEETFEEVWNDDYISLTDVIVKTTANVTLTFGSLVVFFDQIIAVSI